MILSRDEAGSICRSLFNSLSLDDIDIMKLCCDEYGNHVIQRVIDLICAVGDSNDQII